MLEKDLKNLEEIVNLCREDIDNNDGDVGAFLDFEDLKSLKNVVDCMRNLKNNDLI